LISGRFRKFVVFSKQVVASELSRPALQHQYIKWIVKCFVMKDKFAKPAQKRRLSDSVKIEGPAIKKEKGNESHSDTDEEGSINESTGQQARNELPANVTVADLFGDNLNGSDVKLEIHESDDDSIAKLSIDEKQPSPPKNVPSSSTNLSVADDLLG
jgi:hypothetical protein